MAIVRLDRVNGTHLESVVLTETVKNGYFVQLGDLVDGETMARKATKVTDPKALGQIGIHVSPEVDPDPRKAGLKHFELKAGEAGRFYHLEKGDEITLTVDLFATAPAKNTFVAVQANKFVLGEAILATTKPTYEEALVFKVLRETTLGYNAERAFVLQVVKA